MVIGLLGIFSDTITEKINTAINRTDDRVSTYESLAKDFGSFSFYIDTLHDGFKREWIKSSGLKQIVPKYNTAVSKLRSNQLLYSSQVTRFWDENQSDQLEILFKDLTKLDEEVRKLNVEIGNVTCGIKDTIDFRNTKKAVESIEFINDSFKNTVAKILDTLAKSI